MEDRTNDHSVITEHIHCPTCNAVMLLHRRHGVEIDVCPVCRGVWLDRGELDRIVERSERFFEVPEGRAAAQTHEGPFRDRFEWF